MAPSTLEMDPPLFLGTAPLRIRHSARKRLFDIVFSSVALLMLSPLLILIALAVAITSRGPVLYRQTRVGRGGKLFRCIKFRSMYSDADTRLKELLSRSPEMADEWARAHKLKNDPRVTPLGKFLRASSLDELPQFINVLLGDLSVVGPRPLVEDEIVRHLKHRSRTILSIRPGLTCLWQTSGRTDLSYKRRIALDTTYVNKRSFWLDLFLIVKTVPVMVASRGAY